MYDIVKPDITATIQLSDHIIYIKQETLNYLLTIWMASQIFNKFTGHPQMGARIKSHGDHIRSLQYYTPI